MEDFLMHSRIKGLLMLSVRSSLLLSYHDSFELDSKVKKVRMIIRN